MKSFLIPTVFSIFTSYTMKSKHKTQLTMLRFLFVFTISLTFCAPSWAQNYDLVGDATPIGNNCYQLTPDQQNKIGAVWFTDQINLDEPFDISCEMYFGDDGNWDADGIAFGMQTVSSTVLGGAGSSMGFSNIDPSFIVEFDIYTDFPITNGDLAEAHTAILIDGSGDHTSPNNLAGPIQASATMPNIEDNAYHDIRFTWDPNTQNFTVYFDCVQRLQLTGYDIVNNVFSGQNMVYWGFTAATGALSSPHTVCVSQNPIQETDTVTICNGGSTQLTPYITNGSNYSWTPATGLSNANTMSPTASPSATTEYIVEFDDPYCGFTMRDTVLVEVTSSNPDITFNSNTFTLCASETATIEVDNLTGTIGTVTYDWSTGSVTDTETASPVAGQPETWVYLTITDDCGDYTDSVKLVLGEVAIDQIDITPANDCPPNLSANNGEVDVVVTPSTNIDYELSDGSNTITNTTGNFTGLQGGGYILTVTDANGCASDSIINVGTVNNPVAFTGPSNIMDATCAGINDGSASIGTVEGGIMGEPYTVTWIHTDGTTITETVDTLMGDTQDTLQGGNWLVTVEDDGGCETSATFTIDVPPAVEVNIESVSNPVCNGENGGSIDMTPNGGVTPYQITWSNGASTEDLDQIPAGSYTVTVEDDQGCQDAATVEITEPPAIDIDLTITPVTCYGADNGMLESVVNEAQGNYTQWNYLIEPGGIQQGLATGLSPGEYTFQFFDSAGCEVNIPFTIDEAVPITYEIVTEPAYCRASGAYPANGTVSATNVNGGAGGYVYTWTDGTNSVNTPTWGAIPGGTYTLTIRDAENCEVTEVVQLDSLNPEADFTVTPMSEVSPVDFDVENTSGNVTENASYSWHFEEIQTSTSNYDYAPDTSIVLPGEYEICLTVTNVYQCTDELCQVVEVLPELQVNPPNIFTPNADGVNDVFHLGVSGASTFNCQVFTRWGTPVFEWSNPDSGWDGTNKNGTQMPEGVYFYKYSIEGVDGSSVEGNGNVQLLRD